MTVPCPTAVRARPSRNPSSFKRPQQRRVSSRARLVSRSCRPRRSHAARRSAGASAPSPSGSARFDDLGRFEQVLVGVGLLALAHDAAPLLERIAAADQRGVDDEPAAGFDPALELRAARVVDVPAPSRKHEDGIAARRRRATRAARSSRRASRRASAPRRTGSWPRRRAAASAPRPRPIRCCRDPRATSSTNGTTRITVERARSSHAAPSRSSAAANSPHSACDGARRRRRRAP